METYLWSDTHFGHVLMAKNRHFDSQEEMNEALILRWNKTVGKKDKIYLAGDFGFYDVEGTFARLNGVKYLAIGNHDERNKKVLHLGWEEIKDRFYLRFGPGKRVIVDHYPLDSWKDWRKGVLMCHGHCHGGLDRFRKNRFDVGVENFSRPVNVEYLFSQEGLDLELYNNRRPDGHQCVT